VEQFFKISANLADIFLAAALILALIKYKLFSKNEKWYIYYALFVFCVEMILFIRTSWTAKVLYPIYIAGEFFLLTGIFIKKLKLHKYTFVLTGILSLVILGLSQMLPHYENDYSKAISNLIIVCLIAYSLIQEIKHFSDKSHFIILDAVFFLYYTVSIFIFMFQHQLLGFPVDYFYALWIINNTLLSVLYFTFLYTFLKLKK